LIPLGCDNYTFRERVYRIRREVKKMAERVLLTEEEVIDGLERLSGWSADGKSLKRRFEFGDFAEALAFVNKAGAVAEAADHHPDICFGWGYAELGLTTHDRGGITDLDFEVAAKINEI